MTKAIKTHSEYVTLIVFHGNVTFISTLSHLSDAVNSPNDKMVSVDELERCGLQRSWLGHDPFICLNQACQIGDPWDAYGPFDSCDCLLNFSKTL